MLEVEKIMDKIRENIPYFKKKYGVKNFGVFGSYIRGEQNSKSDLDILVEFDKPIGLLGFVALERELGELVGKKVDLVVKTALKPRIGKRILEEVVNV